MTNFEIKNNLVNEIAKLANEKYDVANSYAALWGSASSLLTIEQLEIMKSVFSK